MKALIAMTVMVLALSNISHASVVLFHFTTTDYNQLTVRHDDGKLTYRFGSAKKSELVFSNDMSDVGLYGNKYGSNIEMHNGNTMYHVVYDYINPHKNSGVFVSRNDKTIANVLCRGKPTFNNDLFYELFDIG